MHLPDSYVKCFKLKINSAVSTDGSRNQRIDLGSHTEACMTRPETCGTAGGAVSFWLKDIDCGNDYNNGIISTQQSGTFSGFNVQCHQGQIR